MAVKPVKNTAKAPAKPAPAVKKPAPKVVPTKKAPAVKKAAAAKVAPTTAETEVEVEATGTLGRHDVALALREKVAASGAALPEKLAETVVKGFEEVVEEAVAHGKEINLPGFGKFAVTLRPARVGRNPQTGESVQIAASYKVAFKAGKVLKDAANSREAH
jgi:DNA-binding protein HU-beta